MGSAVDLMGLGGGAFGALGVDVVAEGAAFGGDRRGEDGADRGGESVPVVVHQRGGGGVRVEASEEEGFIGVDVADAGEDVLIEQDRFDGAGGVGGSLFDCVGEDGKGIGA